APSSTHAQYTAPGRGSGAPLAISTTARNTSANGNPNRKRTWVAPTVPSAAVSSRCAALRTVWLAAAMTVKSAQSQDESLTRLQHEAWRRRNPLAFEVDASDGFPCRVFPAASILPIPKEERQAHYIRAVEGVAPTCP